MRVIRCNSNNFLIITSNRTVESASIDGKIFPCFIIMSRCCTLGLFNFMSVIWLFSVSSWLPRPVTLPVKPSATVLRTAIKIKHLLMLILCISGSVWAVGGLWVTHTQTHTRGLDSVNMTRVHTDQPGSELLGIQVQGLKSCQVIFSLRRPVLFFASDVKGESLMPRFKSRAVAKLDCPPITEINVTLLPVTITPDLLLR